MGSRRGRAGDSPGHLAGLHRLRADGRRRACSTSAAGSATRAAFPNADRIATWNGSAWGAVSSSTERIPGGDVLAIAVHAGKVYAGGTFQDAGGNADFLAVWDGVTWEPFCGATGPGGNVSSLEIIGETLYVGGAFPERDRQLPARLPPGRRPPEDHGHSERPTISPAPCTHWRPTATARSMRAETSST